jgi:hypothetical protein
MVVPKGSFAFSPIEAVARVGVSDLLHGEFRVPKRDLVLLVPLASFWLGARRRP